MPGTEGSARRGYGWALGYALLWVMGEPPRRIPTTLWSVVRAAGGGRGGGPPSRDAFATLCRQYQYPVYAFFRRSGVDAEEARDLTQAFFTRLLEGDDLAGLDPSRGRFRTWLKVCLKHFLANHRDHQRAQKRGGGQAALSLDAEDDEQRYQREPSHDLTPERLYDQRWLLGILERVLERLRQQYAEQKKGPLFESLKGTLIGGVERPWAEVAAELKMKDGAVRVAAFRLRERFDQLLRAEVADTLENPADVDDELEQLKRGL